MGKKRSKEGGEGGGSPKKKHKKNKHKKHHYVVSASEDLEGSLSPTSGASSSFQRPITLKIKLGDRLISSSSTVDLPPDDASSIAESEPQSLVAGGSSSVGGVDEEWEGSDISLTQDISEDEGEEEAWLDALEAGQVNERGYLPQKKDVSTLTARQRAMLGEGGGEGSQLMELPLISKQQAAIGDDEMTEEMLLKKTEKNRKRRLAAQKRKEKRKAETVRKLLEKQSTKKRDEDQVHVSTRPKLPHMRYVNTMRGVAGGCGLESSLSLPPGMDYPLAAQKATEPPPPLRCAAEGCTNLKKYSDPISKLPLCSLECYKKSRASVQGRSCCEQSPMIESPS